MLYRSYGRAPKMIHLESNFVQFKEELLPKEGNKALLTFPFLHIYWTECCVSTCGKRCMLKTKLDMAECNFQLTLHPVVVTLLWLSFLPTRQVSKL